MSNESKHNLAKLIGMDIITVGRVPLLVLLLIFATAMGVVFATHHTRQAINQKDVALQERERLDNEWRNLLLEENALSEHSRYKRWQNKSLI